MRYLLIVSVPALLLLCQCKSKDKPNVNLGLGQKILVCNEGNFGWGNADFDVINTSNQIQQTATFKTINKQALGDVLQSATVWENSIFLIVNNSGKIVEIDKNSYQIVNQFTGFGSPRYILPINNRLALVTDLYASVIYIFNRNTGHFQKLPIGAPCEKMALVNNIVALGSAKNKVYFFDINKLQIADSLQLFGSASQVLAHQGNFYSLVDNRIICKIEPGMYIPLYDTNSKSTFLHFQYHTASNQWVLHNSNTLYTLQSGSFIPKYQAQNIYNFSISPQGDIAISDSKNYVQAGQLHILNVQFQHQKSYSVGIIPGESIWIP